MTFDVSVFSFLYGLSDKSWLARMLAVFFAKYSGYLLIIFFAVMVFRKFAKAKERLSIFLLAALSVVLSRGLITEAIRFFFPRPRPFSFLGVESLIGNVNSFAFPSGHMAFYVPLLIAAYFFFSRRETFVFGAAVILMGLARVMVGVHWPSDILVGMLVGSIGYGISWELLKPYKLKILK